MDLSCLHIHINLRLFTGKSNATNFSYVNSGKPASVVQLDAPPTGKGGLGFDTSRGLQHSFVEIDREIFSTVILSLPLIQEG